MIKLVLNEVVEAIGGRVRSDVPTISVSNVSTDSRTVGAGDLFFALSGPRFDGHSFVVDAMRRGALGAVIAPERAAELATVVADAGANGVLIEVRNPVVALGQLAVFHARQVSADVIAVVGSNGKSTTKAMIDHILQERFCGRCNPASFNNAIGVPLTLLSAEGADDYLVVEIGTNAPGEVAELAKLARPNMAVITCIAEEHLEGLGDLRGVAAEECSILPCIEEGGFAAVNVDWPGVREFLPKSGMTVATFGRSEEADVRVTAVRYESPWLHFTINNRFEYRLRMPGVHNAVNAAGAITIARRWGLEHEEIAERLASFSSLPMRSEVMRVGGVTLINDAYNANPDSAVAAIESLEMMPTTGRRVVVFGEMRELGERTAELHLRIAQKLAESNVNNVLLVGAAGEMMGGVLKKDTLFGPNVVCCETVDDCLPALQTLVREGDVVLLKASRAIALDRLVEPLGRALGDTNASPTV